MTGTETPWERGGGAHALLRIAVGAGVCLVALFLLLASIAVSIIPSVVFKAPYKGSVGLGNSTAYHGCGRATVVKPATFNKTTGTGGFAFAARTPLCTWPYSDGLASGYFEFITPVMLSSGNRMIVANWTLVANGSEMVTVGTCPKLLGVANWGCAQYAAVSLSGTAYLYDATTGNFLYASNSWSGGFDNTTNSTTCYLRGCVVSGYGGHSGVARGFSFSSVVKWYINWTGAVGTDHYYLVTQLSGYVNAATSSINARTDGGSASAILHFDRPGHGARLNSIAVT